MRLHIFTWVGGVLLCLRGAASIAPLSLFGSTYLFKKYNYPTNPSDGVRNRAAYARQYGEFGQDLIHQFSIGHHPGHRLQARPPAPSPFMLPVLARLRRRVLASLAQGARL